jgi:hypothetical protein
MHGDFGVNAPFHRQPDDREPAGWLIRAKTPGFLPQDYLAALPDPEAALLAVRRRVGAEQDDPVQIIDWLPQATLAAAGTAPGAVTAS